jgi:cytoskeletal protein CcmA (bactofilin family)
VRERTDQITGPYRVSEDLLLHGMIAGDTTVATGVTLNLTGMVTGDLHVESGARALLYGTVSGSVVNRGSVELEGEVGDLTDLEGGTSRVSPDAVIRSQR